MTSRPSAVFFDVDGVLLKSLHTDPKLNHSWMENLEADLGIIPDELVRLLFRSDAWPEIVTGKRDLLKTLQDLWFFLNARTSPEELLAYWLEHDTHRNEKLLQLIAKLKANQPKLKFYVATTQEHNRADYLWTRMGFAQLFDGMFYSARIGADKKSDLFYQHIRTQTGLTPEKCLLIDDTPAVIEAAAHNGWQTFLADDYDQPAKILKLLFSAETLAK